jgi:peptide/nickel transport system permease protein
MLFVLARAVRGTVILWLVSVITFLLFFLVPKALGSNPAVLFAGRSPDAGDVAAVAEKLGLDKPLPTQYWDFVRGIVAGRHFDAGPDVTWCPPPCLGYSFKSDRPVWEEVADALPVTCSLAGGAAVVFLAVGIGLGVVSALKAGSLLDRFATGAALVGASLPVYFTGLVLLLLVSYEWGLIENVHYVGFTANPLAWAANLAPAWAALAFLYAALYTRLTRASLLETLGEDYVRTARAKGLPESRVVVRHALRAGLTPIVTIFGLDLGALLGGTVLTEQAFSLHGLGKMSVDAIDTQDLPVVMGVTMFAAFFVVTANIVVDVVYTVVDPRVRPT